MSKEIALGMIKEGVPTSNELVTSFKYQSSLPSLPSLPPIDEVGETEEADKSFWQKVDNVYKTGGEFVLQALVGSLARPLISAGLDVAIPVTELITGKDIENEEFQPEGVLELFLGEEPVKPFSQRATEQVFTEEGFQRSPLRTAAGLGGLVGFAALEESPFLGTGKAGLKLGKEVVGEVAERGAKLVDELKPLLEEARKFKTADEFVKAQPKVYHGTNKRFEIFDTNKGQESSKPISALGSWFTTEKGNALNIAKIKGGNTVIEATIKLNNPKIYPDFKTLIKDVEIRGNMWETKELNGTLTEIGNIKPVLELKESLVKQGFDGIKIERNTADGVLDSQFIVFDPANIKTKSQLEEIWKEAQGISKGKALPRVTPSTEKVVKAEYTLLKDRIRNIASGARKGKVATKKEIKGLQTELVNQIKKELPVDQRGKFITAVKNTQTETQLAKTLDRVDVAVKEFKVNKALSKELGTRRSKVAFIKKQFELNQTVANEIKKDLGIKDYRKATVEQMDQFIDKLKERASFKAKQGFKVGDEPKVTVVSDDLYKEAKTIKYEKTTKEFGGMIGDALKEVDKLAGAISTRLKNISPELKNTLRKYEFNIRNNAKKKLDELKDMYTGAKKFSKEELRELHLAMLNGDEAKTLSIFKKHGIEDELVKARKVLDDLYKEAKEVGFDIGYKKGYWPRVIKDAKGFLKYFEKDENWSILQEAIQRKEMDLGRMLNVEEKANLINTMIRGYQSNGITLAKTGAMKTRKIDLIEPELAKFYQNPLGSIPGYIESTTEAIEARKIFGKFKFKDEFDAIDNSIGRYTAELLADGKITPTQELELRDILMARFGKFGSEGVFGTFKKIGYIGVLGDVTNAITQVGDLAFTLFKHPIETLPATLKTVFRQNKVKKADLGIEDIAAEFSDQGKLRKVLDKIFTVTGFRAIDTLGKETFVEASLMKYKKIAKNPTEDFVKTLDDIFGDSTKVLDDLQKGKTTEDVKYLLFNDLLDIQPVALSEMPERYLRHPKGRIFYMLKSYTLKKFDVYRNEVVQEISAGIKSKDNKRIAKGLKSFVALTGSLMVMEATADSIKDFITGRDTTLEDRVVDNMLKLAGFSRYTTTQIKTRGLSSVVSDQLAPPMPFIDSITKDLYGIYQDYDHSVDINKLNSVRTIPVGGDLYYWWFGKGVDTREKSNKKITTDKLFNDIKDLPVEERKSVLLSYIKSGEIAAEDFEDVMDDVLDKFVDEKLGVTERESKFRSQSTKDRAETIYSMLKNKTPEEKQEIVQELVSKKILTESVIKQMLLLAVEDQAR